MNIYEIIRRWHAGQTISSIAKTLHLDRKTVRSYIQGARKIGVDRESSLPEECDLLTQLQALAPSGERQKPAAEQFEPYREEILALTGDREDPLTLKSACEVITHRHPEITASYSSLKRLMRGWKPAIRRFRCEKSNKSDTKLSPCGIIFLSRVKLIIQISTYRRRLYANK